MPLVTPYPGHRPPEVDKIWVIVPFSRPEFARRVWQNFERQRFPNKQLILVENGAATGTLNHSPAIVLRSTAHPAHARNEAIAYIKKQGGGFFTSMDDDDWYGPGYLDEIAGYARSYDAVGKPWHFTSLGEGFVDAAPQLLLCNRTSANSEQSWLMGGTISGWAETAEEFRAVPAEDLDWSDRMRVRGARLRGTSVYHYLYRRSYFGAKHAWRMTREAFLRMNTQALEFPLTPEGQIDFDLVTGERAPTEYKVVGQKRFIPVAQTHPPPVLSPQ